MLEEKERYIRIVEDVDDIIKKLPVWRDFSQNPLFSSDVRFIHAGLRNIEETLKNGIASELMPQIPLSLINLTGMLYRSMRCCQSLELTGLMALLSEKTSGI